MEQLSASGVRQYAPYADCGAHSLQDGRKEEPDYRTEE